jgi:peptidyl-prolyl cis-trans isomerase C
VAPLFFSMRLQIPTLLVVTVLSANLSGQAPVASHTQSQPLASPKPYVVARVNGTPVMSDRLAVAMDGLLPATSFHGNVDPTKVAELRRQALDKVINEELQCEEAVRLGVPASAAEIAEGIGKLRQRYKTPEAFQQALRANRVTMQELEREVVRSIRLKKVVDVAVTSKSQLSEAEAAEFYKNNLPRFVMPEQVHVFAITIGVERSGMKEEWAKGKKIADDVRARILAGESFETSARTHSTDPSKDNGGDMGWVHRGRMTPEFEEATKDMKPGDVSDVVQTIYGYHIVRIAAIKPPEQRSFEQVKTQLLKDLSAKRREELNAAWIAGLRAKASIVILDQAPKKVESPASLR